MPLPMCLQRLWRPATGSVVHASVERYVHVSNQQEIELIDNEWLSLEHATLAMRSLGFILFPEASTPSELYFHFPNRETWLTLPTQMPRRAYSAPDLCRRVQKFHEGFSD